jgi:hypothetical protein
MMFSLGAVIGPVAGTAVYSVDPAVLWVGCGLAGVASLGLALAAGRVPGPPRRARCPPGGRHG